MTIAGLLFMDREHCHKHR